MAYFSRNTQITVDSTSPIEVSDDKTTHADSLRVSIICINTSTAGEKITIAIDGEAEDGSGIVLSPGGSWQDSQDSGYVPTQARITAISDIDGATLSIQERLR